MSIQEMPMAAQMPSSPTPVGSIFDALPSLGRPKAPAAPKVAQSDLISKLVDLDNIGGDPASYMSILQQLKPGNAAQASATATLMKLIGKYGSDPTGTATEAFYKAWGVL